MGEDNLNGDSKHKIVRIGNTVHRPTGWWTRAVHGLLKYLEDIGFKYSPRVLGIDDEGREVLSFIEGESGKDGWKKIISEDGLRKYAKLVRDYHEAVLNYQPDASSEWAYAWGGVQDGQIICHGDIGVWNTVWKGG